MGLRRSTGCDQRRRRVLIEEKLGGTATAKRGGSTASAKDDAQAAGKAYTEAALAGQQPPAIAVLAVRPWTLTVVFLSVLTAVVGLHVAYGQLTLLPASMRPAQLLALDVESAGSLVTWVASLLLVAAAFQGVQVYRLRRHKTDDYRGRYRVWSWIPLVFLLMGACVATGLQADLVTLLGSLIDPSGAAEHIRLSPIGACLLWTLVAVRLAFEIRDSRGALAALAVATCCYFAAAVGFLVEVHAFSHVLLVMARSSIATVGHLCVFLTVAVFGRRVYLEAQGLLQRKTPRRRKTKTASKATRPKSKTKTEQRKTTKPAVRDESDAEETPNPVISLQAARQTKATEEAQQDEPDIPANKMTKADRRRQRKLKRQDRRAA